MATIDATSASGYVQMNVEDIVRGAGVSRRTFYELFTNKHDAFLAAFDAAADALLAAVRSATERETTFEGKVIAGVRAFLEALAATPGPARVCIVEALAAGPEALDARDSAVRSFAELLEPAPAERSSSAPGITALALVGGVNELLYGEIRRGAAERVPRLLPDLTHWVVRAYLGDERAAEERDRARMPVRALALQ